MPKLSLILLDNDSCCLYRYICNFKIKTAVNKSEGGLAE